MAMVISQLATVAMARTSAVTIGTLIALDPRRGPLVDFPDNPCREPLAARATIDLAVSDVGREVTLQIRTEGDPEPVVTGVVRPRGSARPDAGAPREVVIDGERLVLAAQREIVLRCGEASITLTRAGKILLHGTYLLNRSDGVNRILGGSVEIN
jgi:hypothetical protein